MDQLVCSNEQNTVNNATYNALVTEIYDSVTRPEGFAPFVERVCKQLGCLSGDMAAINMGTGEYVGGWQYGHQQEDIKIHIEKGFIHQDPLVQTAFKSPIGHFIKLRDTISWDDYIKLDIYKEWGSRFNLFDATGTILSSEGKIVTGIFFQRNQDQQLFSSEDLELLNALVPHLHRAISLYLRLLEHDISNRPLKEALNLIKSPTILFDRRGIVTFANSAANEFAAARNWLNFKEQLLEIRSSELKTNFSQMLSKTVICSFTEEGYSGGVIHADINGDKVAFCLQPMNASNDSETHGGALLFIHQQNQTIDESKIRMIEELFHLTSAEAQVSLLLSQGMSIKSITEFTDRKSDTIRTHLKSAFSKTGVNSQSQLVSLILTSPVFLT